MPKSLTDNMTSEGLLKRLFATFLLAAVCYAVLYKTIEHQRAFKGPWEVVFTNTASGEPAILINQQRLQIANFQVSFEGEPPPPRDSFQTVLFNQPRPVPFNLPMGKCIFMDTTFLPGTVVIELYGHQVELMPRVLVIDRQERPWSLGRLSLRRKAI